jgi:hypothetical protein
MNAPRPNTTREALIAEVLGELDGLLARVEALPEKLTDAENNLSATVAVLTDAGDRYRLAITAFNDQAKAELTEYLERTEFHPHFRRQVARCPCARPARAGAGGHLCDGSWLHRLCKAPSLHRAGGFFVTRAKSNLDAHRVYSREVDRASGLVCDQSIALDGFYSQKDYPDPLRRVRFKDPDGGKSLVFLSNHFD